MEITKETILGTLADIIDPELHIGIVDLGLIYDVRPTKVESNEAEDGVGGYNVEIDMTLTSVACPMGPQIRAAVHHKAESLPGVKDVTVNLIFNPPWDPREHASEDAQMELGLI